MMVSAAATPAPSASSNGATNGVHPLLRAVIYEDAAEVKKLLLQDGVNAKRKDGATCLHAAAYVGNVDLVAFLLTRGGDAAIAMESGATPVHCAAGGGHNKVLELFVEKGFIDEGEVQKMLAEAAA